MSYFYEKGTLILPSIDNIICHIYKKGIFISDKGHIFQFWKKWGASAPSAPGSAAYDHGTGEWFQNENIAFGPVITITD